MRVNRESLKRQVDMLNKLSKNKYQLEGAYGGWQVYRLINGVDTKDGVEPILSGYRSAREIDDILYAILRYLALERRAEDVGR